MHFLPSFGSKLGQKWAKCTGSTIKPVHIIESLTAELFQNKTRRN